RSAARLAARLDSAAHAAGRLCLARGCGDHSALVGVARGLAPLVLDVPREQSPSGAAALADLTVLVAPASGEPALAELAAHSLTRDGRRPITVVSRAGSRSRWESRARLLLPE